MVLFWYQIIHCMVESFDKCKNILKKKLDWSQVVYYLKCDKVSHAYLKFKEAHPDMARSRCAYNVLKHYYTITFLRGFKRLYYQKDFEYDADLQESVVYYFVKLRKPGVFWL